MSPKYIPYEASIRWVHANLQFAVITKYEVPLMRPSLIAGLDCGLDRWTGLLDWIAGSNQTASKGDDACVAHGTASKAEV